MDTIVGLGKAGCNIVDEFSKYSQYVGYKLDVGLDESQYTFPLERLENLEDYERKCPDLTRLFERVDGEVLFVIGGGGKISSAALAILRYLNHCQINVLYVKPDLSFLGVEAKLLDNLVYKVLQEYARSGVFKRLWLIDNVILEQVIPDITIKNFYQKLNEAVVSTFHMINIFNHTNSIADTFSDPPPGATISTIGFVNPEKNQDKMFFLLDNVSDVVYYYGYNKMKLEEENNLFSEIKNSIKKKNDEGVRVTYGIFETDYKQDYIYCINHSSVIQA